MVAKRLGSGLQNRLNRSDSDPRLHFFCFISWHISCLTASLTAVVYGGTLPCSLLVKHDLCSRYFAKIVGWRTGARGLLRSPLAILLGDRHPAAAGTACFARRVRTSLCLVLTSYRNRHPAGAGTACFARRVRTLLRSVLAFFQDRHPAGAGTACFARRVRTLLRLVLAFFRIDTRQVPGWLALLAGFAPCFAWCFRFTRLASFAACCLLF